jgi:hypothetical protein
VKPRALHGMDAPGVSFALIAAAPDGWSPPRRRRWGGKADDVGCWRTPREIRRQAIGLAATPPHELEELKGVRRATKG